MNMQLARVYIRQSDPMAAARTWQDVMNAIPKMKTGSTRVRWAEMLAPQPRLEGDGDVYPVNPLPKGDVPRQDDTVRWGAHVDQVARLPALLHLPDLGLRNPKILECVDGLADLVIEGGILLGVGSSFESVESAEGEHVRARRCQKIR